MCCLVFECCVSDQASASKPQRGQRQPLQSAWHVLDQASASKPQKGPKATIAKCMACTRHLHHIGTHINASQVQSNTSQLPLIALVFWSTGQLLNNTRTVMESVFPTTHYRVNLSNTPLYRTELLFQQPLHINHGSLAQDGRSNKGMCCLVFECSDQASASNGANGSHSKVHGMFLIKQRGQRQP